MDIRKTNGHFRAVSKGENGEKVYTFTASTSDPDRHKTVVNQKNWKLENFNLNPIIGYQHNLYGDLCGVGDPDDVIGKSVRTYIEDDSLMIDVVFDQENEKARKIQSKVERGFLNTVSVGFIELGEKKIGLKDLGQDPELEYFEGQELLEVSIVNIPSNPKANKKALRSQTFDALKYIYRELGGEFKLSEIESMSVRDILDLLNKENDTTDEEITEPVEVKEEPTVGDPLSTNSEDTEEDSELLLELERDQEVIDLIEVE